MIAALLLLALLGGWEAYARLSGIDEFVLPAPSAIGAALYDDRALLWSNFTVTAGEIGLGMLVALVLGLGCAVAMHFSATLRRALYPLLIGSQTIPIVLVAPLLVVWWGFGLTPKLAIVALVCFFPDRRADARRARPRRSRSAQAHAHASAPRAGRRSRWSRRRRRCRAS